MTKNIVKRTCYVEFILNFLRSVDKVVVGFIILKVIFKNSTILLVLASAAAADGVKVVKNKTWRRKGQVIPEVFEEYCSVGAELNVMPFCSQFIPMEVVTHPKYDSICYHPSILPRHRGASAINW